MEVLDAGPEAYKSAEVVSDILDSILKGPMEAQDGMDELVIDESVDPATLTTMRTEEEMVLISHPLLLKLTPKFDFISHHFFIFVTLRLCMWDNFKVFFCHFCLLSWK